MKRRRGETILALIFLILFAVLVMTAMGYSRNARRMPLIVGIPGLALATVEVLRGTILKRRFAESREAILTEKQGTEVEEPNVTHERRKILKAIGWMVLLVGMIWVFGFFISIPLFTLLFMKANKESWALSIFTAILGCALIYFLFIVGLHIYLYPGLVFNQ